jgi:hypothetical protein
MAGHSRPFEHDGDHQVEADAHSQPTDPEGPSTPGFRNSGIVLVVLLE